MIFVHSCFRHGHACRKGRLPESNVEFWRAKIRGKRTRDAKGFGALEGAGWKVCVVWRCEIGDQGWLRRRLIRFLDRAAGLTTVR